VELVGRCTVASCHNLDDNFETVFCASEEVSGKVFKEYVYTKRCYGVVGLFSRKK
jgi:hypothetical protein